MNILTLIACVLLAVGGCFAAIGDYHMLQQNSYFISRYRKWLCGSLKKYVGRLAWVIVLLAASFNAILFLLACAAFAAWEVYISLAKQKKAIKPLVFTARVKRMMTTNALLLAAAGALSVFVSSYFLALMIALACFTPLTAVAVITINEPAEALVRRRFINDAKRILREHKPMTIIGVTGSFGKTSTKYALARILSEKYNVALTPGSFNTPLGVVRTVREKLKPADDVFIVEMGAKNVGDIREICDIVHPDECLITSVGPQHLDTFGSIENVARTKFELADAVAEKGGRIYVAADSEEADKKAAASGYRCLRYGSKADCDFVLSDIKSDRCGAAFTVTAGERTLALKTRLLGAFNIQNIAGAVAVALDLGVSERDIAYAVASLEPVSHRLELKPFINGSVLIDDAYNSNPTGCMEAVNVLATFDDFRRIIVTPGLVELGDKEFEYNFALGEKAAEKCSDIILVGEERAKPIADGVRASGRFDKEHLHIVKTFKDAMSLLSTMTDSRTAVLFENDLPDNYAK